MAEMRAAALAYYANASEEYKEDTRKLFRAMDANEEGYISLNECKKYLAKNKLHFGYNLFRQLDANGDGFLDFDDIKVLSYLLLAKRIHGPPSHVKELLLEGFKTAHHVGHAVHAGLHLADGLHAVQYVPPAVQVAVNVAQGVQVGVNGLQAAQGAANVAMAAGRLAASCSIM